MPSSTGSRPGWRWFPSSSGRGIARLVHPGGDGKFSDYRAQIMRSLVIGDRLFAVSAKGLMGSDLGTLEERSWLQF